MKVLPVVQEQFNEPQSQALMQQGPEAWITNALHEIRPAHVPQVEGFLDHLTEARMSHHTKLNYLSAIRTLEQFDKPYAELTKADLKNWAKWLDANRAPSTANLYRIQVKRFMRWIHFGEDGDKGYPECVKWIKVKREDNGLEKQVLSAAEIKALVDAADTQRDRALMFVAYESGCRASELTGLRLKDIKVDKYGAVIRVAGKTGSRRLRLFESVPDLQLWLGMHPWREDPNAPLWSSRQGDRRGIDRRTLDGLVRKYAKKARIKGISAHTFRHSRATHLATVLKEAQMREFFGWSKDSEMPSIYVHLSGRDVDETLFQHYGIKPKEAPKESPLAPRTCPRCKLENSASARFCQRCSAVLDLSTAIELEARREQADEINDLVIQEFVKRAPELVEQILKDTGKFKPSGG